jgi:hypothetical protein
MHAYNTVSCAVSNCLLCLLCQNFSEGMRMFGQRRHSPWTLEGTTAKEQ